MKVMSVLAEVVASLLNFTIFALSGTLLYMAYTGHIVVMSGANHIMVLIK